MRFSILPYYFSYSCSAYNERYKFTGKERDWETGYDYYGARFLWSANGHWLSVDPLADKYPNISPYAYCNWNPVKYVDQDGRWAQLVVGALIGGASDYAFQVGMNMLNGDDFTTALTNNINYKSIAVSAATSAVGVGLLKSLNKARQVVKTVNSVQKVLKQEQKMQKAQKATSTIKPNGGNAKPHGGQKHNAAIDRD